MAEAVGDMASEAMALPPEGDMSEINLPVGEGGGALSPLSGAYLLVVLSEPMSESHKKSMVQKLRQGKKKRGKKKEKKSFNFYIGSTSNGVLTGSQVEVLFSCVT